MTLEMKAAPWKVMVADDDRVVSDLVAEVLRRDGFEVVVAKDGREAIDVFAAERPDAVVLDLMMPEWNGIEVLERLRGMTLSPPPVIMLTGHGDIPTAVEAMRRGAWDFLAKPFITEDLLGTIRRAVERQDLLSQVETLRRRLESGTTLGELMGQSAVIQAIVRQVQQVVPSPFGVVILGETGTGKELVARAIHRQSTRRARPLIALDCGAVPETLIESELFGYEKGAFTGADRRREGYFQLADGATLFLDEIANLPLTTQAKLLRVLQERQVQPLGATRVVAADVRVLAATNLPLEAEVQAGRFRRDLYYRLSEFTIRLPSLRERPEDIPHLARRFLDEVSLELRGPRRTLSADATDALVAFAWPGNVRELRNVVRRAALVSPALIGAEHVRMALGEPPGRPYAIAGAGAPTSLKHAVEVATAEVERRAIVQALQATGGNKSDAARALVVDYKTLHLKMKRYGISAQDFRPRS
jgi:two-component system nitrogen regulation response regulator GlnG